MATDLYAMLGIERGASEKEIKAAYKKLAMKHHPDRNPGNKQAEERFKEVSHAFEVLGDREKRKLYDEFGEDGLRTGFDPEKARAYQQWANKGGWSWQGGGDGSSFNFNFGDFGPFGRTSGDAGFGGFEDLLGGIFGGRKGGRRGGANRAPRSHKARDVESSLEVELATALNGDEMTIQLGSPDGSPRGSTLKIKVPAGVTSGSRIRLKGKGEPGEAGQEPGDLIVVVTLKVPALFEQQGEDLMLDLPITVAEAVEGAAVAVPMPEGGEVKLKVPPRSQSGDKLRLRGRGLPLGVNQGRGNLVVRLLVILPELDNRNRHLVEQLEQTYRQDVRAALRR